MVPCFPWIRRSLLRSRRPASRQARRTANACCGCARPPAGGVTTTGRRAGRGKATFAKRAYPLGQVRDDASGRPTAAAAPRPIEEADAESSASPIGSSAGARRRRPVDRDRRGAAETNSPMEGRTRSRKDDRSTDRSTRRAARRPAVVPRPGTPRPFGGFVAGNTPEGRPSTGGRRWAGQPRRTSAKCARALASEAAGRAPPPRKRSIRPTTAVDGGAGVRRAACTFQVRERRLLGSGSGRVQAGQSRRGTTSPRGRPAAGRCNSSRTSTRMRPTADRSAPGPRAGRSGRCGGRELAQRIAALGGRARIDRSHRAGRRPRKTPPAPCLVATTHTLSRRSCGYLNKCPICREMSANRRGAGKRQRMVAEPRTTRRDRVGPVGATVAGGTSGGSRSSPPS